MHQVPCEGCTHPDKVASKERKQKPAVDAKGGNHPRDEQHRHHMNEEKLLFPHFRLGLAWRFHAALCRAPTLLPHLRIPTPKNSSLSRKF